MAPASAARRRDHAGIRGAAAQAIEADHIRPLLHAAHRRLVERGVRDWMTVIASGGIVMAEHVPKALICGADADAHVGRERS